MSISLPVRSLYISGSKGKFSLPWTLEIYSIALIAVLKSPLLTKSLIPETSVPPIPGVWVFSRSDNALLIPASAFFERILLSPPLNNSLGKNSDNLGASFKSSSTSNFALLTSAPFKASTTALIFLWPKTKFWDALL